MYGAVARSGREEKPERIPASSFDEALVEKKRNILIHSLLRRPFPKQPSGYFTLRQAGALRDQPQYDVDIRWNLKSS